MQQTMCLHQVFRPPESVFSRPIDGRGNCQTCIPDEANRQCVGYVPIKATTFFVRGKDEVHLSKAL